MPKGNSSEGELKKRAAKSFDAERYEEALPDYSRLLSLSPADPIYNYRYGVCLLEAGKEKSNAASFLETAAKSTNTPVEVWFFLGKSYMFNNDFQLAQQTFEKFKQLAGDSKSRKLSVDDFIKNCYSGNELAKSRKNVLIVGNIEYSRNSFYSNYDFTNANGRIVAAAEEFISPVDRDKKENNVMFIGHDKQTAFVASYGKKGDNGKDIYIVRRQPDGKWSQPENLGDKINTAGNEDYPYLDKDGRTLYFSSTGHNSIGGYDLFKSTYDFNTRNWSAPVNLGIPVNTIGDDYLFVPESGGKNAMYATTAESVPGSITIRKIELPGGLNTMLSISGVYLPIDQKVRRDARISVLTSSGDAIVTSVHTDPRTGQYELVLSPGQSYMIVVEGGGYLPHAELFELPDNLVDPDLKQIVKLNKEGQKEEMTLQNYFASNATAEPSNSISRSYSTNQDSSSLISLNINNQTIYATKPALAGMNLLDAPLEEFQPTTDSSEVPDEISETESEYTASTETTIKPLSSSITNKELKEIALQDARDLQDEADRLRSEAAVNRKLAADKAALAAEYRSIGETNNDTTALRQSEIYESEAYDLNEEAQELAGRADAKEAESKESMEETSDLFNNKKSLKKAEETKKPDVIEEPLLAMQEEEKEDKPGYSNAAAESDSESVVEENVEQANEISNELANITEEAPEGEKGSGSESESASLTLEEPVEVSALPPVSGDTIADRPDEVALDIVDDSKEEPSQVVAESMPVIDTTSELVTPDKNELARISNPSDTEADNSPKEDYQANDEINYAEANSIVTDVQEAAINTQPTEPVERTDDQAVRGDSNTINEPIEKASIIIINQVPVMVEKEIAAMEVPVAPLNSTPVGQDSIELGNEEIVASENQPAINEETSANNNSSETARIGNGITENSTPVTEQVSNDQLLIADANVIEAANDDKVAAPEEEPIAQDIEIPAENVAAQLTETKETALEAADHTQTQTVSTPDTSKENKSAENVETKQETPEVGEAPREPFARRSGEGLPEVKEEARQAYREYQSFMDHSHKLSEQSLSLSEEISKLPSSHRRDSLIYVANDLSLQSVKEWQHALQKVEEAREVDPDVDYKMNVIDHANNTPEERVETVQEQSPVIAGRKDVENEQVDSTHYEYPAYQKVRGEIRDKQVETINVFADGVNLSRKSLEAKDKEYALMDEAYMETNADRKAELLKRAAEYRDESERYEAESKEKFALAQTHASDVKKLRVDLTELRDKMNSPEPLAADVETPILDVTKSNEQKASDDALRLISSGGGVTVYEGPENKTMNAKTFALANRNTEGMSVSEEEVALVTVNKNDLSTFAKNSFSTNNPKANGGEVIPMDPELPEGLVFKIQVGAFKKKISAESFGGLQPLTGETTRPGWIRYCAGMFRTFEPANTAKNELRKQGYKDAFVVAYYNGKRIGLNDAYVMLKGKDNLKEYQDAMATETAMLRAMNIKADATYKAEEDKDVLAFYARQENSTEPEEATTTASINEGVMYAVQLAANKNGRYPEKLNSFKNVESEPNGHGWIRFRTETYSERSQAEAMRKNAVSKGISDAFVIRLGKPLNASINTSKENASTASASKNNLAPSIVSASSAESASSVVPTESSSESFIFRVQIGAFKNNVPYNAIEAYIPISDKVITQVVDERGLHVFYAGNCSDFNCATELKKELAEKGIKDAFIVALKDGKRIPVSQAMKQ